MFCKNWRLVPFWSEIFNALAIWTTTKKLTPPSCPLYPAKMSYLKNNYFTAKNVVLEILVYQEFMSNLTFVLCHNFHQSSFLGRNHHQLLASRDILLQQNWFHPKLAQQFWIQNIHIHFEETDSCSSLLFFLKDLLFVS